ncbi:Hypothetical protein A7982_11848 [Minicystis rosea]|nr:Hypothetical protein A7982_11845 [Minicystis rosea]APR86499.1 Hypothetical protein A7982_11848 [Minicystis rosea]
MRRYMMTAMDEFVVSTTAVYTSQDHNQKLGSTDQLAIQVIADQISGTSPTLTLQIEHSADGRNWASKAVTPEINVQALSSASTNVFYASDAGATPTLSFVRFKITLGGTSPVAHLKVNVTGRDEA